MSVDIKKIRNIGISAHIDAGKTTLTERILFYTRKIHAMHDVKGKDGIGATMDFMELERERGITITSAATYCLWDNHEINIIDTPGHVDFTIEVERSLRVLDGAILVLCAVGGVQSQSITVNQQMTRYKVPCIAFINKCDRVGANVERVITQLKTKLHHNPVLMQLPLGLESEFDGVIDLISMKAYYFDGQHGEQLRIEPVPDSMKVTANDHRERLIDSVSLFSNDLTAAALDGEAPEVLLRVAIRQATIARQITPVFIGSAYKNKAIQLLLNGIVDYLPNPLDVENNAIDNDHENQSVVLLSEPEAPLVAFAFKLEDGIYGQLTYIRVYQGTLRRGDTVTNVRTNKKLKIGRLVRMHADKMEDIEQIEAGYIGALFGIDCASGDTFVTPGISLSMTPMHIPEPVISLSIHPQNTKSEAQMFKALTRFTKEDPTFKCSQNEETGETIISGMGELHLEIYIERMLREYNAEVVTGAPEVSYREAITQRAMFDYIHKKQTGGSGQFARVTGYIEPATGEDFIFEDHTSGGVIPEKFMAAAEKGFRKCLDKGGLCQYPVTGLKVVVTDGATHTVDSSNIAFEAAARGAFYESYHHARPVILEPVMRVVVETPPEFQGVVMSSLNQRRGMIIGTQDLGLICSIEAQVPLAEMFGYSTVIRSSTQGKAQFTMEFQAYRQAPRSIADELLKKAVEKRKRVA